MTPIEKDRDMRLVAIFAAGVFIVTAATVSTAQFATAVYAQQEDGYTAPAPQNSLWIRPGLPGTTSPQNGLPQGFPNTY